MDEIKNKDEYNPDIVTLSDDDGKEYTSLSMSNMR